MSDQKTEEWNINRMPWRSNVTDESVINFVGSSTNAPQQSFPPTSTMSPALMLSKTKRKFSTDPDIDL